MNTFQIVLMAVGSSLGLAILAGILTRPDQREATAKSGQLSSFLLANGNLTRFPVISLLVSSSSSLNSLFYQLWLGYSVGAWSLVAQGAWAISFILLSRFPSKLRESKSLHAFLSSRFGPGTRICAAVFSVLGFLFLMGWEVALGQKVFGGFILSDQSLPGSSIAVASAYLAGITVAGALIYTLLGGLRGNAIADILQNVVKLLGFGLIMFALLSHYSEISGDWPKFWRGMFPSVETMTERLGWFGLITNVIFSIVWQFVDASTWQNVQSGANRNNDKITSRNLCQSGLTIFIAPGILGTVLGVALTSISGVTQDNILVQAVSVASASPAIQFLLFFAIATAMMSLIDGLLIASGYAICVDLLNGGEGLETLERDEQRTNSTLALLRLTLIILAFMAAWGVGALTKWLGTDPFETVYLVIIPQLALTGPVLVGIFTPPVLLRSGLSMTLPIIMSGAIGLSLTWAGAKYGLQYLSDGAGAATAAVSLIIALAIMTASSGKARAS